MLKGLDIFLQKVPALSGKRIILLPLYVFSIIFLCLSLMMGFDTLPVVFGLKGASPLLLALSPLAGELIVCVLGFALVWQMWFWKEKLKAKYGALAYQSILLVGFAGISCVLSLALNMFVHYWWFSRPFWMFSPLKSLVLPLEWFLPFARVETAVFRLLLAFFFTVTGFTLIIRSLFTFGFDYMSVLYLYYPQESKVQNHAIYSILRHPTYTGALLIGLGGMFYIFTLYSVIFYLVLLAGFCIHIHFVEERELIVRFGQSYMEYMKQVPAFIVKPAKLRDFLAFLLGIMKH
jgi:protein-S-isoprenylcysteine O-methyltransferase Ste14